MSACQTCGQEAGLLKRECRPCVQARLENARQAEVDEQTLAEALVGASNLLGLPAVHDLPKGPDWYTCDTCGRREQILVGGEAKAARIAALFDEYPESWPEVVRATRWGMDGPGWGDPPVLYPSTLQEATGMSGDDALAKLEVASSLGMLTRLGGGYGWAGPLCAPCYGALQDELLKTAHHSSANQKQPAREPIPARLRFLVLQRDAFRCQYCGRTAQSGAVLHVDHVVPLAVGGETTADNLLTACADCNLGKSATPVI